MFQQIINHTSKFKFGTVFTHIDVFTHMYMVCLCMYSNIHIAWSVAIDHRYTGNTNDIVPYDSCSRRDQKVVLSSQDFDGGVSDEPENDVGLHVPYSMVSFTLRTSPW